MTDHTDPLKAAIEALQAAQEGAGSKLFGYYQHAIDGLTSLAAPRAAADTEREAVLEEVAQAIMNSKLDQHCMFAALVRGMKSQPAKEQEPWIPYLSDRADGCKGRYAIARWTPAGYREVWNLHSHKWAAFSDDVLTLEQAQELMRNLVIPTDPQAEAQQDSPVHFNIHIPKGCDCQNVQIGSYTNQVELPTPPHMLARGRSGCTEFRPTTCVDRCIAPLVQALWDQGIVTTGCCCGHNEVDGYIGIEQRPDSQHVGLVIQAEAQSKSTRDEVIALGNVLVQAEKPVNVRDFSSEAQSKEGGGA